MRAALGENMSARGELGAAVAVFADGRQVVDLWCGWADAMRTTPWREHTLVNVFSVGKAFAGLCALVLASRGMLELDAPLARHWPRFAAAGQDAITVRQLLGHRAGLAAIERELPQGALYEWQAVTDALAEQRPWWEPGSAHGYHVHTFGFLVGELVRRVAGEPIDALLRREVAQPLGVELSFGLAPALRSRRAEYVFDRALLERGLRTRGSGGDEEDGGERDWHLYERAYMNPPGATGIGTVNTPEWMGAVLPSANLHADARGLARVYAALIEPGQRLLSAEVLEQARAEQSSGTDRVLGRSSRFGLGFQLTQPERPLGPNAGGFGHFGAGGSLAFADPEAGIAFAYVMNRGGPQWRDPRNSALVDAVYASL